MTVAFSINLDGEREKFAVQQQALGTDTDVSLLRVSAVRGSTLPESFYSRLTKDKDAAPGTMGCFLSHVHCWEMVLQSGAEWAAILEDDTTILPEFSTALSGLDLGEQDLVFVNNRMCLPSVQDEEERPRFLTLPEAILARKDLTHKASGADGYLLSRQGAARLLEQVQKDGANSDVDWFLLFCATGVSGLSEIAENRIFHRKIAFFQQYYDIQSPILRGAALARPLVSHDGQIKSVRRFENDKRLMGLQGSLDAFNGVGDIEEAQQPRTPPQPQLNPGGDGKVRVGRNGRLFLHNDTNGVLDQHLGRRLLSEQDLAAWQETLDQRQKAAQQIGAQYQLLIAPDTAAVYPEDHPDLDGYDGLRPVLQLQQSLRSDTPWLYPLAELKEARSRREVCHPTDSHWTGYGAYIAYRALARRLDGLRPLVPKRMTFVAKEGVGDLGDKFSPPLAGTFTDCFLTDTPSEQVWNNGISNRGYMGYWRHRKSDLPRAVLFMDSYGWKFSRFLSASFSEMFIVHTPYFEHEAIEKYKPDVVVNLMAERFLIKVPNDHVGPPALQTAKEKDPTACYPDLVQL